jgi:Arginase family
VVHRIVGTVVLAAMDIVEVSPPNDHAQVTTMAAHRVAIEAICGRAVRSAMEQPSGSRRPRRSCRGARRPYTPAARAGDMNERLR